MKVELARIGNSRGIRILKPLIEQCGFGDQVELRVTPDGLVVAPVRRTPRAAGKKHFARHSPGSRTFSRNGLPVNSTTRSGSGKCAAATRCG